MSPSGLTNIAIAGISPCFERKYIFKRSILHCYVRLPECIPFLPRKPTFLERFMVNHLVFRWPKPLFFMVLGAHIKKAPYHFPANPTTIFYRSIYETSFLLVGVCHHPKRTTILKWWLTSREFLNCHVSSNSLDIQTSPFTFL